MRYLWIILCCVFFAQHSQATNKRIDDSVSTVTPDIKTFLNCPTYSTTGFVNVYIQNGKYYMEIPDDKLQRDILVTITILKGAARKERTTNMRFGYGGDSVFDTMIRLVKHGKCIEFTKPNYHYSNDSSSIYKSFLEQGIASVLASLPIVAVSSSSSLIDITEMIKNDDDLFSLHAASDELKLGAYQPEQTDLIDVKAFPTNVNFLSTRSYLLQSSAEGQKDFPNSRWEVGASWLLLPEHPMSPRLADNRVGYFTYPLYGYTVNGVNGGMEPIPIAAHWRLEPKPEDMERYKRGELVEPIKPIVYYIDRATPSYLVPYLIKAVNAWQPSFEKIGFKNAIHAELAPKDSLYTEADARYSLVSYKASPIPNAYGPMIVDPRSGEILSSHIALYHSVLQLVQRWYFVMCGNVDKRAREYPLPQDIMGELAATVLTHEVGHTLGLRHNFVGSTAYPTDSLRCAEFIRKNGLGTSIMDYQRFNYIAQPGDKLAPADLLPRIGAYDNFAIEWGYRMLPENLTLTQQTDSLRHWVDMKRKDPRMFYLQETELGDPRVQSEDSGNDIIKSNRYGMANLKRIMVHLEEWTPNSDRDYFVLRKRYLSVQSQYINYIGHVMKFIAGHFRDRPERDETKIVYRPVSREQQLEALKFINEYVFKDQKWLFPEKLMEKTNISYDTYVNGPIASSMALIVVKCTSILQEKIYDAKGLDLDEYINLIYKYAFEDIDLHKKLTLYEKSVQKELVEQLVINAENPTGLSNGVAIKLKTLLSRIKNRMIQGAHIATDYLTVSHYKTLFHFITLWENDRNNSLIEKK